MNEQTIFLAALDIEDLAERSAYVDRACAGNAALRQQVDRLLAAHDRSARSWMCRPSPRSRRTFRIQTKALWPWNPRSNRRIHTIKL